MHHVTLALLVFPFALYFGIAAIGDKSPAKQILWLLLAGYCLAHLVSI